jgi:hypothetical protein
MRAQLLFLGSFAASLLAQQGPQDPKDLLLNVRRKIMDTVLRLPRYMCTQTIDRVQFQPNTNQRVPSCDELEAQRKSSERKLRLSGSDRLRLDVAVSSSTGEIYSWVGEERFDDRSLFDLVRQGAVQTGSFRSFLASIFGGDEASFSYNGDEAVNGRPLVEFGYRVPLEKSNYTFGNRGQHVITGYDGTFLVDPKTLDLVRLTVSTDQLPEEVGSCRATTTLDYTRVTLNQANFLLPTEATLLIVGRDGAEQSNRTSFSACHEFVGKSKLTFEEPEPAATTGSANKLPSVRAFEWPVDRTFELTFTQPVDTASGAAGDVIHAKLNGPIRDVSSRVVASDGAAVTVRIVKLQHYFGTSSASVQLAVKLEAVEVDGTPQPIPAELFSTGVRFPKDKGLSRRVELGTLDALKDPTVGVFEFRDAKANYVIKEGLESTWVTIKPGAAIAPPAP